MDTDTKILSFFIGLGTVIVMIIILLSVPIVIDKQNFNKGVAYAESEGKLYMDKMQTNGMLSEKDIFELSEAIKDTYGIDVCNIETSLEKAAKDNMYIKIYIADKNYYGGIDRDKTVLISPTD